MKLVELSPRWIYKRKIFAFRCPCCRERWLTCKRVVMSVDEQLTILDATEQEFPGIYTPCKEDQTWRFTDHDFNHITVSPSIDASASGHWHGWITNGSIVGGIEK